MTSRRQRQVALAALCLTPLLLAGCGVDAPASTGAGGGGEAGGSAGTASAQPAVDIDITGPDAVPAADEGEAKSIAFFGFARANSFANATWSGIEQYAQAHNATAQFFDPNFDAQTQVSQMQDALTSGRFDVFVVQANDGQAVIPAVQSAISAGISVVVEFTPVGTAYDSADPQVQGALTLIDVPTDNGKALGQMAVDACKQLGTQPCQVAYLEGNRSLPLDNARTEAVKQQLSSAGIEVVASVEGGYTNDSGRQAMQDVLQSDPDVDVVIGSTQAIAGAEGVVGQDVALIGNGGSRQALDAVRDGRWFGAYCTPEVTAGQTAAALGLAAARGTAVPASNDYAGLAPSGVAWPADMICTSSTVTGIEGQYDE
ncbi:sugar ABC transporter substrate-binding protein [Kineococcus sp. SYSU DK006]|uniref:sugar ABC transporter substrate-binding protein n=1 Tax=Kineococcus sp. SYSU DK006 TaxID=3383127 RepID=UPI003D7C522A